MVAGNAYMLNHILLVGFACPLSSSLPGFLLSNLNALNEIDRLAFVTYLREASSYPFSSSLNWPFTFSNLCWIHKLGGGRSEIRKNTLQRKGRL